MSEQVTHETGAQYLFELTEAEFQDQSFSLEIPDLTIPEDAMGYAHLMLGFFRELWNQNGYTAIKTPHHDAIALPSIGHEPPLLLTNSYRGLTNGQVLDRQPYLEHYKEQHAKLASMNDEKQREKQSEKLERILKHLPDQVGLQGIEQYQLIIPPSHKLPWHYRLTHSRGFHVGQAYYLGPEARTYALPTRPLSVGGSPRYPFIKDQEPFLGFEEHRFQHFQLRREGEPYAKAWQERLNLILPLLERHSLNQ